MKGIYSVLFIFLMISCQKEDAIQNSPKLISIYMGNRLIHEFEYTTQGKISKFTTHNYHYHNTGGQAFWVKTDSQIIVYQYTNNRIEKIINNDPGNSYNYGIIDYNLKGFPLVIKFFNIYDELLDSSVFIYDNEDRIIEYTYFSNYKKQCYYQYTNSNIEKVIEYSDKYPDEKIVYELDYDTSYNPLVNLGIICSIRDLTYLHQFDFLSKNNIKSRNCYHIENEDTICWRGSYTYEFNSFKYPINREYTSIYCNDSLGTNPSKETLIYIYDVNDN